MTHTVDTLMALAYKLRYAKSASYARVLEEVFRIVLTEALAQPVQVPLTDDDISEIWDSWLINITDKISAIQFAREIEAAHHIGGDK